MLIASEFTFLTKKVKLTIVSSLTVIFIIVTVVISMPYVPRADMIYKLDTGGTIVTTRGGEVFGVLENFTKNAATDLTEKVKDKRYKLSAIIVSGKINNKQTFNTFVIDNPDIRFTVFDSDDSEYTKAGNLLVQNYNLAVYYGKTMFYTIEDDGTVILTTISFNDGSGKFISVLPDLTESAIAFFNRTGLLLSNNCLLINKANNNIYKLEYDKPIFASQGSQKKFNISYAPADGEIAFKLE